MVKVSNAPELPGMPTAAELRVQTIIVPAIGNIAVDGTVNEAQEQGEGERQNFNPNRRRAFGSVPNLIKDPIHPEIMVTPGDVAHIQPRYLWEALYATPGKKSVDGIAFGPAEHRIFIFSMPKFLERVSDDAEKKYANSNDFLLEEKKLIHRRDALETRLKDHDGLIEGYRGQWSSVNKLQRYVYAPKHANYREGELRSLAAEVWKGPIADMLSVAAIQKGWTLTQKRVAEEAFRRALFYGPQRVRTQNWQVALHMAKKYLEDKGTTVAGRRNHIDLHLKTLQKELTDMYEKSGFVPR